ncbi:MAG: HAD family hydrolase [Syntrophobacterales bacterium]|jgi:putative hydrolase of the HAD superfamily|nr:HAD family hydrolase [Syntrophobacterales bacterium]
MKKIFSFDLDGTLVDGIYGDMVWNHGLPEVFARRYDISLEEAKTLTQKEYGTVGDGKLEWYDIDYWLERFDLPVSSGELLNRYEPYISLLPFVREVLETLQENYILVIASNAARIFVEKEVSHTDIGRHFSTIVSATSDYKIVKKGDSFYTRLLNDLGVSPHEIIHVGDHRIFDFEAPSRLGIESYHLCADGNGDSRVIPNLRVLLERLR